MTFLVLLALILSVVNGRKTWDSRPLYYGSCCVRYEWDVLEQNEDIPTNCFEQERNNGWVLPRNLSDVLECLFYNDWVRLQTFGYFLATNNSKRNCSNNPDCVALLWMCYNPICTPSKNVTGPIIIPSSPTSAPIASPTVSRTAQVPSRSPTHVPTTIVTSEPTIRPTSNPTLQPTAEPTLSPVSLSTQRPTSTPSTSTANPTSNPTAEPTSTYSPRPSASPSESPTKLQTLSPTQHPSETPFRSPTFQPIQVSTESPTFANTLAPTSRPITLQPTLGPIATSMPSVTTSQSTVFIHPTLSPVIAQTSHPTTPTLDNASTTTTSELIHAVAMTCTKVDGGWSPWSNWTDCQSIQLGDHDTTSIRYRTRTCDNPAPQCGGCKCQGDDIEYGECNRAEDCLALWSPWNDWSVCVIDEANCNTTSDSMETVICNGFQIRERFCVKSQVNPADKTCDCDCEGEYRQQRSCSTMNCLQLSFNTSDTKPVYWSFSVKSDLDYVTVRSGDVNGAMCIAVRPWKCYHLTIRFSLNSSGIAEWTYQGLTLGYWNVPTYPPENHMNPRRLWQSYIHTSDDKDYTDEETDDSETSMASGSTSDGSSSTSDDSSSTSDDSSSDENFSRHWSTEAGEIFEVCIP